MKQAPVAGSIHQEAIEKTTGAVEDTADCSHEGKELVIFDEGLAKSLGEAVYRSSHEDSAVSGENLE